MEAIRGFTLTEILISLVLFTSAAIALLTHQWQMTQLANTMQMRAAMAVNLDNASESILAGMLSARVTMQYRDTEVQQRTIPLATNYKIIDLMMKYNGHQLQRQLVL